jgi:hypothetical protein
VTPWQTHLGSEEYEPDAKIIADYARDLPAGVDMLAAKDLGQEDIATHIIPYLGLSDTITNADLAVDANPYLYGFIWEVCARSFPFCARTPEQYEAPRCMSSSCCNMHSIRATNLCTKRVCVVCDTILSSTGPAPAVSMIVWQFPFCVFQNGALKRASKALD